MDSVNMEYRDENSILDQIFPKAIIFRLLLWSLKILRVIEENAYLKKYSTPQQRK